jgi:hypothetical protein
MFSLENEFSLSRARIAVKSVLSPSGYCSRGRLCNLSGSVLYGRLEIGALNSNRVPKTHKAEIRLFLFIEVLRPELSRAYNVCRHGAPPLVERLRNQFGTSAIPFPTGRSFPTVCGLWSCAKSCGIGPSDSEPREDGRWKGRPRLTTGGRRNCLRRDGRCRSPGQAKWP